MLWHISGLKRTCQSPRGVMQWLPSGLAYFAELVEDGHMKLTWHQVCEVSPVSSRMTRFIVVFSRPRMSYSLWLLLKICFSLEHLAIVTFAWQFAWKSTLEGKWRLCQEECLRCSSGGFLMLKSVRWVMCASKHLSSNRKRICDRKMSGFWLGDEVVFLFQMGANCSCGVNSFAALGCDSCMSSMTLGR